MKTRFSLEQLINGPLEYNHAVLIARKYRSACETIASISCSIQHDEQVSYNMNHVVKIFNDYS